MYFKVKSDEYIYLSGGIRQIPADSTERSTTQLFGYLAVISVPDRHRIDQRSVEIDEPWRPGCIHFFFFPSRYTSVVWRQEAKLKISIKVVDPHGRVESALQ